jgi:hypothetical protein
MVYAAETPDADAHCSMQLANEDQGDLTLERRMTMTL